VNARTSRTLRLAALVASAGVVTVTAGTPAYAAGGDVDVVNTETVQVYTSPSGDVQDRRVYEQLALTGHGPVTLRNPISTDGLRNLDGFSGVHVEDGEQVTSTHVDGQKRLRSVSDYDEKLPLDVSVSYRLDGHHVEPGDLVGKSGDLEVEYVVENVTGTKQQVSFPDGKGGTVTRTVDVPVPMVGSLTTVAPAGFTDVRSDQANIAGDGKGGTQLSFTMTLFPPIGSTTADFGYTARITDGVVPRATISALPVNPLASPTFKSAGASYKGGADTGAELAAGATKIDTNLLKLRDGASTLLAGLIKLRDGADQLNAGLAGDAVPGSRRLADGAGDLSDGLEKIDKGTSTLAVGAGTASAGGRRLANGLGMLESGNADLSGGLTRLSKGGHRLSEGFNSSSGGDDFVTGSKTLASGLGQISGGLDQLADAQKGLPAAVQGAEALRDGVDKLRAGLSNPACDRSNPTAPANPCGLLQGLQALRSGLTGVGSTGPGAIQGAGLIEGGLAALLSTDPAHPGLPVAKGGVDLVNAKIQGALADSGSVKELADGLTGVKGYCQAIADPTTKAQCIGTLDVIIGRVNSSDGSDSVDSLREQLTAASGGLGSVSTGLAGAVTGVQDLHSGAGDLKAGLTTAAGGVDLLLNGVARLQAGLSNPGCDPAKPLDQSNPCGLREGLTSLVTGLTGAVAGLGQLAPGGHDALSGATRLADKLAFAGDGAGRLSDGLGTAKQGSVKLARGSSTAAAGAVALASGLARLSAGSQQLADGTGAASDGSTKLYAGADKLADGLGDAADGSGRIADGLTTAAGGAPKLVDGAQQLSDQGTQKLIGAGTTTAQSYGELYATMVAGSKRAQTEDMAFGAPKGAAGLTAYSYVIKGDDGEGGRNLARGLGGLALLGAGGGVFALRRRLL
jgi:putative membrane protein